MDQPSQSFMCPNRRGTYLSFNPLAYNIIYSPFSLDLHSYIYNDTIPINRPLDDIIIKKNKTCDKMRR